MCELVDALLVEMYFLCEYVRFAQKLLFIEYSIALCISVIPFKNFFTRKTIIYSNMTAM